MRAARLVPLLSLGATVGVAAARDAAAQTAAPAAPAARHAADSAEIHDAIVRGARAFERGDPDAILSRYARDVVSADIARPRQLDHAGLAARCALDEGVAGALVSGIPS